MKLSEIRYHNFESAPTHVGPFSHAVECDGWVHFTGQMPSYPIETIQPLPNGIELQTRRVMDNLLIIANGLGLSFKNAISCRVFLTNFGRDYEKMNQVYKTYFDQNKLPARTCVGVTELALGALVEIDMIAKKI